ncbi:tyrosine recombinase XerC [Streptomyces sp. KN37]|uniref:site-specific integrase n=1 Tax=Streptomyces sp. KN37 TaxID=3090667 RepID=UPI002A749C97|nr:tyrosine-type recombinase/integrase [Streptomyces sp. KN37]WPO69910.1 tyrosine-type recombinase/integrase [Streptomyces sp. KN37]
MADTVKKVVLKNGTVRYRAVVDAGHGPDGKRRQLTITRDTVTEVRNEVARIRHERTTGQLILPSKVTVSEWADQWLAKKAEDLEPTTLPSYETAVGYIKRAMGHIRLQALTEDDVENFVQWLLREGRQRPAYILSGDPSQPVVQQKGLRPSSVDTVLARLKDMIGRAYVRKMIRANVAEYVHVPRQARKQDRRSSPKVKPWNTAEVQAFVLGIRDDRLCAPLMESLMGMRPAEVAGQRWDEDVDLETGLVAILNTRTMVRNHYTVEKDTKTTSSERTLPLPSLVWDALKRLRATQARERLAAGEAYTNSGYVMVDELGVPLTTRDLREHAYRLMEQLELRRVRLYDARHAVLKYLAVNGVPDVILAAWAGHTNAAFTKAKYVAPDAEDLRSAADALDGLHGAM